MMEQCEMYRHGYFHAERLQEEKDVQDLKNEVTVMVNRIELLQLHCRLASDIFIPTTYMFLKQYMIVNTLVNAISCILGSLWDKI